MNKSTALMGALLGLALATPFAQATAQSTGQPIVITKTSDTSLRLVKVSSSDPAIQALMAKAFSSHGSFDTTRPTLARHEVVFTPSGAAAVSAEYRIDGAARYRANATGSNLAEAALRAGDLIVKYVTNTDCYFAGKIVFVGGSRASNNIFHSDLFLEQPRQVTSLNSICQTPSISPDGRDVLFVSYFKTGFPDIFKLNLASGQTSEFARFKGSNISPSWSPNGASVAMVLSGTGNPELYVSDNQGRNLRKLTTTKGGESHPAWSPDGSTLVFCSDPSRGPQVYTMPVAGGTMSRLPTNISGNCTEPSFSPKGDGRIIFTAVVGRKFQLCVFEPGKGTRQLTTGNLDSKEPVWLNDGRHVLFTQQQGDSRSLAILDTMPPDEPGKPGKTRPAKITPIGRRWACQADFIYPRR